MTDTYYGDTSDSQVKTISLQEKSDSTFLLRRAVYQTEFAHESLIVWQITR